MPPIVSSLLAKAAVLLLEALLAHLAQALVRVLVQRFSPQAA